MVLIILAAGFSTRLYPRTLDTPKQLLSIRERPLIDHFLNSLDHFRSEFTKELLVTNNKFYEDFLRWNKTQKDRFVLLNDRVDSEGEKLGSVGDFLFAVDRLRIDDDVFLAASDRVVTFDLAELVSFFKEKKATVVAMHKVRDPGLIKKLSCARLSSDGQIVEFTEKPQKPYSDLAGLPYYIIRAHDLKIAHKTPLAKRDSMGFLIEHLHKFTKVYGKVFSGGEWHLTCEDDYQEARRNFLSRV